VDYYQGVVADYLCADRAVFVVARHPGHVSTS
jgi:hypothetical protein